MFKIFWRRIHFTDFKVWPQERKIYWWCRTSGFQNGFQNGFQKQLNWQSSNCFDCHCFYAVKLTFFMLLFILFSRHCFPMRLITSSHPISFPSADCTPDQFFVSPLSISTTPFYSPRTADPGLTPSRYSTIEGYYK